MLFESNMRGSIFPSSKMGPMQKNSITDNSLRLGGGEKKKGALAARARAIPARFQAWRIAGGIEKGKRRRRREEREKRGERCKSGASTVEQWLHAGIKGRKRARAEWQAGAATTSSACLPIYSQAHPSLSIQHQQLVSYLHYRSRITILLRSLEMTFVNPWIDASRCDNDNSHWITRINKYYGKSFFLLGYFSSILFQLLYNDRSMILSVFSV